MSATSIQQWQFHGGVMKLKLLVLGAITFFSLVNWAEPVEMGEFTIRDVTSSYPKNNFYDQTSECGDGVGTSTVGGDTSGAGSILPGVVGVGGSTPGNGNTGGAIVIRPPGVDPNSGTGIGGIVGGGGLFPTTPTTGSVIIDQVINIGSFLWMMVERSRPTMNISTYRAHGLPKGVNCWTDLEEWKIPKSKVFSVEQKSKLGKPLAKFTFRISFVYGGNYNGAGQYLANVTVSPVDLQVSWGNDFASEVQIPSVFNMGTKVNPKAAMQIFVYWGVGNSATVRQKSSLFYVTGDGQVQVNPQN